MVPRGLQTRCLRLEGAGPGRGAGRGQGGRPRAHWARDPPTFHHLASAAGDAHACVLGWSHLRPQSPRVSSNWHHWAPLGWEGERTGTHSPRELAS